MSLSDQLDEARRKIRPMTDRLRDIDQPRKKFKIVVSVLAIIVAIVWISYYIYASRPVLVEISDPATEFALRVSKAFPYEAFSSVTIVPTEDHKEVIVGGFVANQDELGKLKALIANVQPTFPYRFEAKVRQK